MSGSVSKGKESSESLQMIERPLMTPDELKSMPKGQFVVMKTGAHPMRVQLKLFFEWGIKFLEPYRTEERAGRKVSYASREKLIESVKAAYTDTPERLAVDHSKPPERERISLRTDNTEESIPEKSRLYFSEAEEQRHKPQTGSTNNGSTFRVAADAAAPDQPTGAAIPRPVEALSMDDIPDEAQKASDTSKDDTGKAGDDK